MTKSRRILAPRRYWTDAEVALLRALYSDTPTQALAEQLGRALKSVYTKAKDLGLHKSAAYLASPAGCRLRRGDDIGRRFQKGHVSYNKGLRRPGWAPGRMRETQFKKGRLPHNCDPDVYVLGALRVNSDGYIEMRTSFRKGANGWTGLHRVLWRDAHGPVPKGFALCFRNGDKLDVELANLELVSRAELCRRNSIHRLPPALKLTIYALGQLKRRIREREQGHGPQDRGSARSSVRDARGPARQGQADGHRPRESRRAGRPGDHR